MALQTSLIVHATPVVNVVIIILNPIGPVNARAGIAKARDNLDILNAALVAIGAARRLKFIYFYLN